MVESRIDRQKYRGRQDYGQQDLQVYIIIARSAAMSIAKDFALVQSTGMNPSVTMI